MIIFINTVLFQANCSPYTSPYCTQFHLRKCRLICVKMNRKYGHSIRHFVIPGSYENVVTLHFLLLNKMTHPASADTGAIEKLSLGFSPCPNDTFIFDAMVNGHMDTGTLQFNYVMEDVETLNQWAFEGKLAITKLSYNTLLQV